jgi:hypothetical protein
MAFTQSNYYQVDNWTPYTMTLTYKTASQSGDQDWVPWDSSYPPAQSLSPGSGMYFHLITEMTPPPFGSPVGGDWATATLYYDFTDVDGGKHRCMCVVNADKYPFMAYSQDFSDGQYVNSTDTFQIVLYSESIIIAQLTHPAEVTIDAIQDPAAATSVMGNLWPQGTNKQFTVTSGPNYVTGDWSRGSAVVVNESHGQAQLSMAGSDTKEETTSIGMELSWTAGLEILGLVNTEVTASITGGEDWTTSITDTQSYQVTIERGYQGWLDWAVTSAQITGDFTFTWTPPSPGGTIPVGITYHVNNATVTQPGRNGEPAKPAITWQSQIKANPTSTQRTVIDGGVAVTPAGPPRAPRLTGNPSVDIDAATDPDGAAQAMQLWPDATSKNFSATSNPIYTSTQPATISDAYQVPANQKDPQYTVLDVQQTTTSSWSIGGSVGSEITLDALGFANASVSVTFTAGHQWSTSHTNDQSITVEVLPGYIAWITGSKGQATFTGDYAFTAQGTDYTVRNVTVTFPAAADAGPLTAYTYFVVDQQLPPAEAAALTRPGWVAAPEPGQTPPPGRAQFPS